MVSLKDSSSARGFGCANIAIGWRRCPRVAAKFFVQILRPE